MTPVSVLQLREDYPDHRCPEVLEPNGSPRQGYHGGSKPEGHLLYATYIGTACGCKITGSGTLQHPMMVEPCDEHRAAMYPKFA